MLIGYPSVTVIQLYKVKKVKSTKSKSAAKKAKVLTATKKAKGKSSSTKAKNSKPSKPVKKAVSKVVSKPVKKSSTVKKAAKPTKPAKAIIPVKKKTGKADVKKSTKKIAKPAKPVKVSKPVKPAKPAKAEHILPAKADKKEQKQEKKEKVEKEAKKLKSDNFDAPPAKVKKGKGGRKPKSKNDDDEPEIIHDELIEQIIQTTKKQSKVPKKPRLIQTFVNPINSLTVAASAGSKKVSAPKKEPKGRFELEYVVRTSAGILYELLTTPSGLSEWFADDVNIRDGIFTFFWDGSEQKARLIGFKEEKYVRLQWLDKPEGTYFEFRIERDELTGDISLMIVDFADEASDMQTSKLLWDSQVNKLLNVLGSN